MKAKLSLILLLSAALSVHSQEKLEREYRIKSSEVPAKALEFVGNSFGNMKVKWYGEENLNGKSIEAKGKRDGRLFSIEFDTSGALQDIEMLISFRDIPENTRVQIERNLGSSFSKFRIQKTQKQWVGKESVLSTLAKGESPTGEFSTNYEITLRGTKNQRTDYYEVLVNDKGEIIRESKIVFRNNQHLIF